MLTVDAADAGRTGTRAPTAMPRSHHVNVSGRSRGGAPLPEAAYRQLVESIVNYGAAPSSHASVDTEQAKVDAPAPVSPLPSPTGSTTQALASVGDEDTPQIEVTRIGEYEIVVLDSRFDGVEQVTDILSPHHGLAAVQVLSHGASGALRLGSTQVNDQNWAGMRAAHPIPLTAMPANRWKSLSSVRTVVAPCSRHTAAICASKTRLPRTCPS